MAVPRNRLSNSKKNLRRSHHALKSKAMTTCLNCGTSVQPHRVCISCGQYRGKQILAPKVAAE